MVWLLSCSWNSEGKIFVLLRLLEDVICIQIENEPDRNDHSEHYKARTVLHGRKEGKQKNPKDNVVSRSDQGKWVSAPLFDCLVVIRVLAKPREPRGSMSFDANSVDHPDSRKPDQAPHFRPKRSGKGKDYVNQRGNSKCHCKQVIPTNGQEFFFCHNDLPFYVSTFRQ